MGGRTFGGERAPLRMSPGLGTQPMVASPRAPAPAAAAPARTGPTAPGLAVVRQHREFGRWMQDAPSGLGHVLGVAAMMAMGLAFVVLALTGALHARGGGQNGYVVALFVCVGAAIDAFGTWQLVRFYQAPLLRRVACVIEEHEQAYRTKNGVRVRHYATFEFEDGARAEFQVSRSLAAQIVRGDCGVAISRDTVLLAFHRA
jgi:hypothetical protein